MLGRPLSLVVMLLRSGERILEDVEESVEG